VSRVAVLATWFQSEVAECDTKTCPLVPSKLRDMLSTRHAMRATSLSDTNLDDETVAAFLDGRLSGSERERVLARIAASEEWRAILGEAAGASSELQTMSARPTSAAPQDTSRATTSRQWVAPARLLAAGVLIVAGVLWYSARQKSSSAADVLALAAHSELESGAPLWLDRGWSSARAPGGDSSIKVRSARLGVLSVDLLRATALGDTTGAQSARRLTLDLLRGMTGGALVADRLVATSDLETLRDALNEARLLGDTARYDLAARLELLRVAGFRSPRMRVIARDLGPAIAALQMEYGNSVAPAVRDGAPESAPRDTAATLDALLLLLFS
jgi:hypothetical protein